MKMAALGNLVDNQVDMGATLTGADGIDKADLCVVRVCMG